MGHRIESNENVKIPDSIAQINRFESVINRNDFWASFISPPQSPTTITHPKMVNRSFEIDLGKCCRQQHFSKEFLNV